MRWVAPVLVGVLAACGGGDGKGESPPTAVSRLAADPVDFGRVVVGESLDRDLVLRNTSGLQFVTFNAFDAPDDDHVTIVGAAPILPLTIGPGRSHAIGLRYAPPAPGLFVQRLRFVNGFETLVEVEIRGEGIASEIVTDFGDVAVDPVTRTTGDLEVYAPRGTVSLTFEVAGAPDDLVVPVRLEGPGGFPYVDPADPWAGPYVFEKNLPRGLVAAAGRFAPRGTARFQLPNSDDPGVQLDPSGGNYRLRLRVAEGTSASLRVRAIVHRRNRPDEGHVDLNVFLASQLRPHPSVLDAAEAILAQAGLSFGDVAVYDVPSPPADLAALFAEAARGEPGRVPLFFVDDLGGATEALLASPAGEADGVAVVFDGGSRAVARAIARHLGLFELPDDLALDTPPQDGTDNLLDEAGGAVLTPGQAHVLQRHVLVRPGR